MWGRELRAGLVFVLVSLAIGTAVRAVERAHEERFAEIVDRLEEGEWGRLEREAAAARGEREAAPDSAAGPAVAADAPPRRRAPEGARFPALRPASIDVDRADPAALVRLPGIGPAIAARIVADRASRGPFGGPDGLLRVPGIGRKTLAKIRGYLREGPVEQPARAPAAPVRDSLIAK
ncbi:MAG TPA: helix-hairpin-helix domain-containing protein [Candidatus Eisenbacteria bacterium]